MPSVIRERGSRGNVALLDGVRVAAVADPDDAMRAASATLAGPGCTAYSDHRDFSARTGGTLVEKCCHFRDLMRFGLGTDPVRVHASAGQDVNHLDERHEGRRPDIVDNAFVIVDFEGGARGHLDLCNFAEGSHWQETIAITGDRARIEARVPGPARFSASGEEREAELAVADRALRVEARETVAVDHRILRAGDHHGATFFQHERFRRGTTAGSGDAEVNLADGYWSVLVGEAAEESARTGAPVDLRGRGP